MESVFNFLKEQSAGDLRKITDTQRFALIIQFFSKNQFFIHQLANVLRTD
jgi:hypothetical protein